LRRFPARPPLITFDFLTRSRLGTRLSCAAPSEQGRQWLVPLAGIAEFKTEAQLPPRLRECFFILGLTIGQGVMPDVLERADLA